MEFVSRKKLLLFSGRGTEELAGEIAMCLGVELGDVRLSTFSDGELYARYGENVRGTDVFIVQAHCDPINDRIMEQLIMIDAAKRASAKRITAVCPYFGYSRQDHKAEGREPLTTRLVADLFTVAGADRVVTVDLHAGQIQGFFDFPVDHLTALPVLGDYLIDNLDGDVVVVSPDPGRIKLAQRYARYLSEAGVEADLAFIDKRRPAARTTSPRPPKSSGACRGGSACSSTTSSAPRAPSPRPPRPCTPAGRGKRGCRPRTRCCRGRRSTG